LSSTKSAQKIHHQGDGTITDGGWRGHTQVTDNAGNNLNRRAGGDQKIRRIVSNELFSCCLHGNRLLFTGICS
jgi:hypothetical protein